MIMTMILAASVTATFSVYVLYLDSFNIKCVLLFVLSMHAHCIMRSIALHSLKNIALMLVQLSIKGPIQFLYSKYDLQE